MRELRDQLDQINEEMKGLKDDILPLMMASGLKTFGKEGVGLITMVEGSTTLQLKKDKLQANLLRYLDAADVAEVIETSSAMVIKEPYIQFSLPK
jgi:hypothetical protein